MTTNDVAAGESRARLEENIQRIEDLSQRLVASLTNRKHTPPALNGPETALYAKAGQAYWQEMVQNPAKLIEHQVQYWGKTMQHFADAQQM